MFKDISKAIVLLLSITMFSIQGMELTINNWGKSITTGPLNTLQFQETEPAYNGRHFGWLFAEECKDYIFVAITPHDLGYYVDYIDPTFKESLPYGLYYWKSVERIKKSPSEGSDYSIKKVSWSTQPTLIPSLKYNEQLAHDSIENKAYYEAYEDIGNNKRIDRYNFLPSFKKAFDGYCSNVYLFKKIEPIALVGDDKLLIKNGYEYQGFSEESKKKIIRLLPDHSYQLLKLWLQDKLRDTGLLTEFTDEQNSRGYVMSKDRVIDQFVIESLVDFLQIFGNDEFKKRYPKETVNKIDVYKILENIEKLRPCSTEERKEFEQGLINRFLTWDDSRIQGLTAIGIINCNNGLLQWD